MQVAISSKDKIITSDDDKLIKDYKEKYREQFKKITYSIDLDINSDANTNDIKTNYNIYDLIKQAKVIRDNDYAFILGQTSKGKHKSMIDNDTKKAIYTDYLKQMETFKSNISVYLDKSYDNMEQLNKDIYDFNSLYDADYKSGFNLRVKDLLDDDVVNKYARHYANLVNYNYIYQIKDFIPSDLDKVKEILKSNNTSDIAINEIIEKIQDFKPSQLYDLESLIYVSISNILENDLYKTEQQYLKDRANKNIDYYKEVHKLYNEIDSTIIAIVENLQANYDDLTKGIEITNKIPIKRDVAKIPKQISYDIDMLKLFNNIYPNNNYKSIYDNRHTPIDIKAKIILDISSDKLEHLEDMRLLNFIKNNYIALYPIQSAIIQSFLSIRDENKNIDKVIPMLAVLKHIKQDKSLRLPTSKKDLALYEDFMLFFDRCKLMVKIVERDNPSNIIFETKRPLSLLANTPMIDDNHFGYIIGNSAILSVKAKLDEIYNNQGKVHKLTTSQSKQYLNCKSIPFTPTTSNIEVYLFEEIANKINSYKRLGTYNGKIKIDRLYEFQAMYNKHQTPTKDDRDKTRGYINKYLDYLVNKGLITSYEPIKTKNEIKQYKVVINKDAKL